MQLKKILHVFYRIIEIIPKETLKYEAFGYYNLYNLHNERQPFSLNPTVWPNTDYANQVKIKTQRGAGDET